MRYIKEESYPILQGRELYLPKRAIKSFHSVSFNQFKLSLREYDRSFNDLRCENFDMIANYRPYHFNGDDFGLYLYAEMFSMLVLSIIRQSNMSFRDSHTLALDASLTHGSFHYLIERYASLAENSSKTNTLQIYPTYKRKIYSEVWGTAECYEEILANDFILKAHPVWSMAQRNTIEFLIARQRDGYCQALGPSMEKDNQIYDQLEKQIVGGSLDYAKKYSWNGSSGITRNYPKLSEYVEANQPFRLIGLPIYLVNDCMNSEVFERIVKVFFSQL